MVVTGRRVAALREILAGSVYEEATVRPPAPRLEHFPDALRSNILALYHELGGILDEPLLRPGTWDVPLKGGLVLELDEEQHFTRYRTVTLDAPWAADLPWARVYQQYAERAGDAHGGTGGGRWTSAAAEKQFGIADPEGAFILQGAPRWKQRALYDAMKDAAAAAGLVRLARISVYDMVGSVSIGRVLYGRSTVSANAIAELIRARTAGV